MLYPNRRIEQLELERDRGHKKAERDLGPEMWARAADDFTVYTHEKFVTKYCQERMIEYYLDFVFTTQKVIYEPETTEKSL